MFYYIKFTALSIKTICRALSLLVLKKLQVIEIRDIKNFLISRISINC